MFPKHRGQETTLFCTALHITSFNVKVSGRGPSPWVAVLIAGSNVRQEALCIWSENENSPALHRPQVLLRTRPTCKMSGERVVIDLEENRRNICVFICLQGTLQPQTRCLRCGDALEWSEEHRCASHKVWTDASVLSSCSYKSSRFIAAAGRGSYLKLNTVLFTIKKSPLDHIKTTKNVQAIRSVEWLGGHKWKRCDRKHLCWANKSKLMCWSFPVKLFMRAGNFWAAGWNAFPTIKYPEKQCATFLRRLWAKQAKPQSIQSTLSLSKTH